MYVFVYVMHVSLLSVQELSATLISAWCKEELRNKLKTLKKSVDDIDRSRKAQYLQNVCSCSCCYCFNVLLLLFLLFQ